MSTRHVGLALTLALIGGCAEGTPGPTASEELTLPVFSTPAVASAANFHAHAKGSEEIPAVDTRAQGQATFKVSRDGTSVDYKLNVANIEDVTMAHIHQGPVGETGPPVVWLYPSDGPPAKLIEGRSQGVLARGTFTAADLVGPLAGMTLDDLVEAMRAGNTYVNVHTSEFGGGEIRGQIR